MAARGTHVVIHRLSMEANDSGINFMPIKVANLDFNAISFKLLNSEVHVLDFSLHTRLSSLMLLL